ncbi:hypothetical protein BC936DRAFT_144367 [Jimgerdemannia flammicorona]|uniref:Uncharacterized protein n=1 Tax=Jimgerdemannia flammicorona TaxID=994334 RepID=A0A433DM50_9FUNG|nr:hypothetical protein BC936DRAFT_144367 [Jimgerdemannia flammicorona]
MKTGFSKRVLRKPMTMLFRKIWGQTCFQVISSRLSIHIRKTRGMLLLTVTTNTTSYNCRTSRMTMNYCLKPYPTLPRVTQKNAAEPHMNSMSVERRASFHSGSELLQFDSAQEHTHTDSKYLRSSDADAIKGSYIMDNEDEGILASLLDQLSFRDYYTYDDEAPYPYHPSNSSPPASSTDYDSPTGGNSTQYSDFLDTFDDIEDGIHKTTQTIGFPPDSVATRISQDVTACQATEATANQSYRRPEVDCENNRCDVGEKDEYDEEFGDDEEMVKILAEMAMEP